LLAEAYNNGAKSSADEIASLRAQLAKLTAAAETVCGWDWSSNNDEDAVRDVYALQKIVAGRGMTELSDDYRVRAALILNGATGGQESWSKWDREVFDVVDEANDEIDSIRAQLEQAKGYATRFLESFVSQHFSHNPDWEPCPDLIGVLTQIDNATTVARDYKAQLTSAREALEVVRSRTHGEALEHAIVDTSTMTTLGQIVEAALTDEKRVFAVGGDGSFDESDEPEDRIRRGEQP